MNLADLPVFILALLIAASGIGINLWKRGQKTELLLTRDRGSLLMFRLLVPLGLAGSLAIYWSGFGHAGWSDNWVYAGYILVIAGLGIRWVAVLSLGKAFTVQVAIIRDQQLKTDGMYRHIRHPSYTGLLLYYWGLGLAMQNWWCLLLLALAPALAVWQRIRVEEMVLTEHFGKAYQEYTTRSWRVLPWVC